MQGVEFVYLVEGKKKWPKLATQLAFIGLSMR